MDKFRKYTVESAAIIKAIQAKKDGPVNSPLWATLVRLVDNEIAGFNHNMEYRMVEATEDIKKRFPENAAVQS